MMMTAEKTSAYTDHPQHVRCIFSRKVAILVAVCCVAFLAYFSPQVWKHSSAPSVQTASLFAVVVKENTSLGTVAPLADDIRAQDGVKQGNIDEALQPVYPTLTQDEVDVFSSSSDDEEMEEIVEYSAIESVPLKPQGIWKRRLPQAIIIGVKKGGTRALLEFLRMNPQVVVSGKEVHFFDRYYDKGLEWYRKVMPNSYKNQLTMEKTPCYFVTPEVPERIHRMSPDIKFLVVVRDPITRAISDHAQSIAKGKTTSFEDKAMLNTEKCRVNEDWSAIRIGLYAGHLTNWLQYFSIDQFFFVSGENLVVNPGEEMAKVQDFLQIKRVVTEKSFFVNETKGFPCMRAKHKGEIKCLGKSKGRTHNPVDVHVRHCLAEFYRPYNERFYKMTGIDFHWEGQGT